MRQNKRTAKRFKREAELKRSNPNRYRRYQANRIQLLTEQMDKDLVDPARNASRLINRTSDPAVRATLQHEYDKRVDRSLIRPRPSATVGKNGRFVR